MKPWYIVQHVPGEGPGLLEGELSRRKISWHVCEMFKGSGLPPGGDAGGAIVLGGPMNVDETDRFPFLKIEREWLRSLMADHVPILGICLGAQILARAMDAAVAPNGEKEIGFAPIRLTAEGTADPIFAGTPKTIDVFHWHGDRFEIPAGGALLADSAICPHQAFRAGPAAYGFQFHIEITREMISDWTRNSDAEMSEAGTCREKILKDAEGRLAAVHQHAEKIFKNFFDVIVPTT